jgi:hypothetical protein
MNGVPELVRDERLINREALLGDEFEKFALRLEESFKESYLTKFKQARPVVLNLSLVMMCTIIELFFEHVLALIFAANPKTLLALSRDKNISVEQFLKNSTYEAVLEEFIRKTTDHIVRQGTTEILKAFSIIGIQKEKVFSWATFTNEVQERFSGWDEEKLKNIFLDRHSIVHNNALPIQSIEELLLRQEFFLKIILNISFLAQYNFYKYGVILDLQGQVNKTKEDESGV